MTDENALFATMDAQQAQAQLPGLLRRVADGNGRIQIELGNGRACVVLSREELDWLEQALEILAGSEQYQAMRRTLARCVAMTETCQPSA